MVSFMHLTRARLPGSLRRLNFIRRRSALIIATACCWHVLRNAHVGFVPGPTKNLIPVSTPVSSVAAAVAAPFIAVSTNPATAAAAGFATTATDDAPIDPQNAIVQAFLLTLVSEIGDKTFFIAAILAAGGSQEGQGQNQKILTFVGAILALVVMTLLAVGIGQIFHSVPDVAGGLPLDDYASILAFGYFGVKLLYDSTQMEDDGSLLDEKEEAEEDIKSVALPGFLSGGVASLVLPPLVLHGSMSSVGIKPAGGTQPAAATVVEKIESFNDASSIMEPEPVQAFRPSGNNDLSIGSMSDATPTAAAGGWGAPSQPRMMRPAPAAAGPQSPVAASKPQVPVAKGKSDADAKRAAKDFTMSLGSVSDDDSSPSGIAGWGGGPTQTRTARPAAAAGRPQGINTTVEPVNNIQAFSPASASSGSFVQEANLRNTPVQKFKPNDSIPLLEESF